MNNHNKPAYADYDAPHKFDAIIGIIMTRLTQYPNAICSYSGGSDSDIMIDLIETARKIKPSLKPVKYFFINTGLEPKATKDHIKETASKYHVDIEEVKPRKSIVSACRTCGIPFMSKLISDGLELWQKAKIPLEIGNEYDNAENKKEKALELMNRYPKNRRVVRFITGADINGNFGANTQFNLINNKYLREFMIEHPPDFKISDRCCELCKKNTAHKVQKDFDVVITGERMAEGGARASFIPEKADTLCFYETKDGQYRFRPLFYVSDKDKAWYKETNGIRYSDAYEVYGLKRIGCFGCPINHAVMDEIEKVGQFEPNLKKAAWNVFGKSYEYRQQYNEYKKNRFIEDKNIKGQTNFFDRI